MLWSSKKISAGSIREKEPTPPSSPLPLHKCHSTRTSLPHRINTTVFSFPKPSRSCLSSPKTEKSEKKASTSSIYLGTRQSYKQATALKAIYQMMLQPKYDVTITQLIHVWPSDWASVPQLSELETILTLISIF